MPEPKISLTQEKSLGNEEGDTTFLNKTFTRREVLKGMIFGGLALTATACGVDPSKASETPKNNLKNNIEELNNQFGEIEKQHLDEQGYFNFERFKTNPEFQIYTTEIHTNSQNLERELEISPNVLKLITSSIIATNLGNWQEVDEFKNDNTEKRIGPMQFYPSNVLDTLKTKLGNNYEYNMRELKGRFNIQLGMRHLVYGCLGDIKNDGENKNLIELTLAKYYGGDNLLAYIKSNREVPEDNFLRENYDLYTKTLRTMNPVESIPETSQKAKFNTIEISTEEVWQKALVNWPETNLKHAKQYFTEQAHKYYMDQWNQSHLGVTEQEYLALFISIAMAESLGGTETELGPHPASGAVGWFQVIPQFHLYKYNELVGIHKNVQYNENQLRNDPEASIEVGTWALMRYRHAEGYRDIKKLMEYFKAGELFYSNWESGLWWNRVTYCMTRLLDRDTLNLGYMDYEYPKGTEYGAENFEGSDHLGKVITAAEEKEREKLKGN